MKTVSLYVMASEEKYMSSSLKDLFFDHLIFLGNPWSYSIANSTNKPEFTIVC